MIETEATEGKGVELQVGQWVFIIGVGWVENND